MYGKCRLLGLARKKFDEIPDRDVMSYNAVLGAHAMAEVDEGSKVSLERSGLSGVVVVVEGAIGELKSSEEEKKQMIYGQDVTGHDVTVVAAGRR
ncbi:hypothetical protein Scep_004101 [Stephania cephalantha]|uniref:Uncharacterized protein n=1 Tax=Stephania cephalantha TaxID=152367 RepID=A0AAP0KRT0_9MAGN